MDTTPHILDPTPYVSAGTSMSGPLATIDHTASLRSGC